MTSFKKKLVFHLENKKNMFKKKNLYKARNKNTHLPGFFLPWRDSMISLARAIREAGKGE